MAQSWRLSNALVVCAFLLIALTGGTVGLAAEGVTSGSASRQMTLIVSYQKYDWWLIRWSDNRILCQISVDHESWPTGQEVYNACGSTTYNEWIKTPPCSTSGEQFSISECAGLYLHQVASGPAEKSIVIDLPSPVVWVALAGCSQETPENRCERIPSLLLSGEEPLPNEHITAIHAVVGGLNYSCEGETCEVPLQPTSLDGATVEFWADSSYGDSSQRFTALVRVVDSGIPSTPIEGGWFVDVLSKQWRGKPIASCAQLWNTFPPVGGLSGWLSTPEVPDLLASGEPYHYLAGRLIAQGLVDATACPAGGLLSNGYADACGLEKALPLVQEWQNRFDAQITQVALETGVPAQLMKNVFAQESQFWPGAFKDPREFGLGQLTDHGAETILLWNPAFFSQFCPMVLDASACARGYVYLDKTTQALLRGALALQVKADCPDCPEGIDLTNVDFSIGLFAQTFLANCSQVSRIVYNATNRSPGTVSSYEDLWRFTVANYHIGPGCISYAMYGAWARGDPMDWEHVSTHLTPACQGVISYVEKVSR